MLDIRKPLGALFVVIGAILFGYGAIADPAIYERSLGINLNLWWGELMTVVGAVLLWLSYRSKV